VTCEVAPHHFTLTDEALEGPVAYDTNVKMNPPLREARDRDAMIEGIADGSVDVIATDHAPHHYDEKHVEFDRAPFGIVGLETPCRSRSTGSCTRASSRWRGWSSCCR
jgi:dihydroorotase